MNPATDGVPPDYRALYDWLMSGSLADVRLPVSHIEEMLGHPLPEKAWSDPFWWASIPRHSWARSWLRADRAAAVDVEEAVVTFTYAKFGRTIDLEKVAAQRLREINLARDVLRRDPRRNAEFGWWEPHIVYVLHKPNERLFKVGLTNAHSRRISEQTSRGRAKVESTVVVPNRWDAKLVESRVLELTDHVRKLADPFNYHNGQTEHWDDTFQPPDLATIATELSQDVALRYWHSSIDRTTYLHR